MIAESSLAPIVDMFRESKSRGIDCVNLLLGDRHGGYYYKRKIRGKEDSAYCMVFHSTELTPSNPFVRRTRSSNCAPFFAMGRNSAWMVSVSAPATAVFSDFKRILTLCAN